MSNEFFFLPSCFRGRSALQNGPWRDAFLKKTGGQMWMTHDLIGFSKLKKSPAFYDQR